MTDIRLSEISKSYNARPVLRDVALAVPDGSVLALLGPSGCGKTTLLRLIAGFERPNLGEIRLGPTIVESDRCFIPPERRHVGYVPQEGALFPHLSVTANIGFGLRRQRSNAHRVMEMLRLVDLVEHAEKFPRQLSGGQQQRVALARALAPDPAVILLDEPFNALDLDLRRKMSEDVVRLLRQAGTTTVLVTHDPTEAFAAADLVAVMDGGSIIQCGPPAEIYHAPTSPKVAGLTGSVVLLEGIMRAGRAETPLGLIPAEEPCPPSGQVTVLFRPEQLRLDTAGRGCAATVIGRQFRGDHTDVTVAVGGLTLTVQVQDPPAGAAVFVGVKGACRVFPTSRDVQDAWHMKSDKIPAQ